MINRVGEQKKNKWGSLMTIVKYNNAKDIVVEFENGYKVNTQYGRFKNINIKSPYDRTIYNVGFYGVGEYLKTDNFGKKTIQYEYWHDMLKRCYDDNYKAKQPTYKNKYVCEEWHNFQNFAKWFDENYYEINGEIMQIDKDILQKGNKIYSPETCVFVPNRINSLFTKSDKVRGKHPIGVYFNKKENIFKAQCSVKNKNDEKKRVIGLGRYNTSEEAFNAYKVFKERYIKEVADEYKDKIPQKLYEAMYNYIVEIND